MTLSVTEPPAHPQKPSEAQTQLWCHQAVSMTSLISEHMSKLCVHLGLLEKQWRRQREKAESFSERLRHQYEQIGSPSCPNSPNRSSSQIGESINAENECRNAINEILTEWETIGKDSDLKLEEIENHKRLCSVFESFYDENPLRFVDGKVDRKVNVSNCTVGESCSTSLCEQATTSGKPSLTAITDNYKTQLSRYRESVLIYENLLLKIEVHQQLLNAERLKMKTFFERVKHRGNEMQTINELPLEKRELRKTCEKIFIEQESILDKCHTILWNVRETGQKIQGLTKLLTGHTKSMSDYCSALEDFEKQWISAVGSYTMSEPVAYLKNGFDSKKCYAMNLKEHDKRFKSLSRLVERQTIEHAKNAQLILTKWSEYHELQTNAIASSPITEAQLAEFLANCQEIFTENNTAIERLYDDSDKNCVLLRGYMREIYGDPSITSSNTESEQQKGVQRDEYYMDYTENVERYHQSFEIVKQSKELYSKYLAALQKRAIPYNKICTRFTLCSTTLAKERSNAEQRQVELKESKTLMQSFEKDLNARRTTVESVKEIFLTMKNIHERCKAIATETEERGRAVKAHSESLQSQCKLLERYNGRRGEVIQNWNAEKQDGKMYRVLKIVESDHFAATLQQKMHSNPEEYDRLILLYRDQLIEAAAHCETHSRELADELKRIVSDEEIALKERKESMETHAELFREWQEYKASKQSSIPLLEEIIWKKMESIHEYFPQISLKRGRGIDERNATSAVVSSDVDEFYCDRFSRKSQEILACFAVAKRSMEEFSIMLESCNSLHSTFSKLKADSAEKNKNLNLSIIENSSKQCRTRIDTSLTLVENLYKEHQDSKQDITEFNKLIVDCQNLSKRCKSNFEEVRKSNNELLERNERLENAIEALETTYESQGLSIQRLNLGVHSDRVGTLVRMVEDQVLSPKGLSHHQNSSADDTARWMEESEKKVTESIEKINNVKTQLEKLLDSTCQECSEKNTSRILTDLDVEDLNESCFLEEFVDTSDIQRQIRDMEETYEKVFSRVTQLCPAIKRLKHQRIYNHFVESGVSGYLNAFCAKFVEISK